MNIETTNFENYTADEYRDNLLRLGAVSHSSLISKTVYYVKPQYGEHKVVKWDEDKEEWEEQIVKIYKLNWINKLKWIWKQWLFEKCVGYHCSYKNGKIEKSFYYRKPKWLYVWIFNKYYRI